MSASWTVARAPSAIPKASPCSGSIRPATSGRRAGAGHARVAVAVDVVVDRPGAAGGQVAAEHRPEDRRERRARGVGDEHRRDRGQQQQRDDPRLGQRDVVAEHARADGGRRGGQRRGRRSASRQRPVLVALSISSGRRPPACRSRRPGASARRRRRPAPRQRGGRVDDGGPESRRQRQVGDDQRRVLAGPDVERAEQDLADEEQRERREGAVGTRRRRSATAAIATTAIAVRYMNSRWVSWMSASRPYCERHELVEAGRELLAAGRGGRRAPAGPAFPRPRCRPRSRRRRSSPSRSTVADRRGRAAARVSRPPGGAALGGPCDPAEPDQEAEQEHRQPQVGGDEGRRAGRARR